MKNLVFVSPLLLHLVACSAVSSDTSFSSDADSAAPAKRTDPANIQEQVAFGLDYPYDPPNESCLFVSEIVKLPNDKLDEEAYRCYPYVTLGKDPMRDGTIRVEGESAPVRVDEFLTKRFHVSSPEALNNEAAFAPTTPEKRPPTLAYGSNRSPKRLSKKFITQAFGKKAVFPLIKVEVEDFVSVAAAHLYVRGNPPATLAYAKGVSSTMFLSYLETTEQLPRMHYTEGVDKAAPREPTWYSFGQLSNVNISFADAGWQSETPLTQVNVYIDKYGPLTNETGQFLAFDHVPTRGLLPDKIKQVNEREILTMLLNARVFLSPASDLVASEEVKKACDVAYPDGSKRVERFACEAYVDPCLRDRRTQAIAKVQKNDRKVFEQSLPANITYTVSDGYGYLGGSPTDAGDPPVFREKGGEDVCHLPAPRQEIAKSLTSDFSAM